MLAFHLEVVLILIGCAFGQNTAGYTWTNVYTGGGGGYIPNIIFSPSEQNLIYVRTDIGGAYRWNPATNLWVPLMDWVSWNNWNMLGVESLATDPVNPQNLYIMAGLYTNSFTSQKGTLLISHDQGNTFPTQVAMPFKVGGNMPARNMGERLAIDPNDNSILFFAARSGNGLWESTNSGLTWSQVTSFPQPGTYAVLPGDIYQGDIIGPAWVVFDPRTGSSGKPTQTIYVGVAQPDGPNIFVSKNGGTTWSALAGQPTCTLTGTQASGSVSCTNGASWTVSNNAPGPGFFPDRAVLAPTTGMLYITYSNGAGPYDGTLGDVQQYNTATGAWTNIAPVVPTNPSNDYFGYCGLTVDAQKQNTIMVSAFNSWWPDTIMWRSTNGGASWSQIWNWTSYPNRSLMYTLNNAAAPWTNEGDTNPVLPIMAPELGWMVSGMAIDPFNSDHMLYGTGMTMWGTNDLTQWDSGNQFALSIAAQGIEETNVLGLVSPPAGGGAHLYSALGDASGFAHVSMTTAPTFPFAIPFFGSMTSIDYAESSPQFMVIVGNGNATASPVVHSVGFTFSGGTSETSWFTESSDPPGYTNGGGGTVAAAADASRVVWNPSGMTAFYSTNNGSSWTAATGLTAGGIVVSDRVNPLTFYAYVNGRFYVSTNGGVSFAATSATGLPASGDHIYLHAVPGIQGDVWLAGGSTNSGDVYGLWHSTNGGTSFTQVSNVQQADTIGFGKAAPGSTYPALFTSAQIGGVRGIFRSDNEGATWIQINDSAHQYGMTDATITGDPQIYGTVYLGTNGRGIIMGTLTSPPVGFTLAASPTSVAVTQGSSATDTITVTDVGGFTGSVTLSASGLPSGVTASFGTNPTTGSSLLTLTASSTAATGSSTVTITGTSGSTTASTTIALTVNQKVTAGFTLAASPASISVTQGNSATDTISVTDVGGFTGSVTLSASGLPSGVTASFGTNPTTGTSVLTLAASSTAATGSSTVTITGTSGSTTASTTIALTVNPKVAASFTLAASPTSISVTQGSSATDTISVTDVGGFTGSVTLSASGLPSGVTASFGTNPTTGTSVLTLSASSTAATGTSTVTITGTSGTLTASTAIPMTVSTLQSGFACHVIYTITNQWPGGFGAAITINNTGTTAISSWTLTWSFANGQTITQVWNGTETQSGANVTVNNLSYNGSIPAGGSYNGMGFNGSWNNTTNAVPTSFAVNGTTCN